MATETEVKKMGCDILRDNGYIVERLQSGKVKVKGGWMQLCDTGTPDTHIVGLKGFHFYWETKKPGGKPSKEQLLKKADYESRGFLVYITDSYEELEREAML